ncbi:hypothetical protein V8G54_010113 [Vigna mungo]|uniref:Uncharacterized protein n=1 Tax=Vigna mungo TaxID=3915 RepID=A0AAQ3S641_VIGMU
MEENKQKGISLSLTSEFFGPIKESHLPPPPSSAGGIFGSIFSPLSSKTKVLGRESLPCELSRKIANETRNAKIGIQDHYSKGSGSEAQNTVNNMSSIYQDQRVQPCHLSSSIYYGGQDICPSPQSTHNEGFNTLVQILEMVSPPSLHSHPELSGNLINWPYQNDAGDDESELASRGNWWQGML